MCQAGCQRWQIKVIIGASQTKFLLFQVHTYTDKECAHLYKTLNVCCKLRPPTNDKNMNLFPVQ